MDVRLIDVNNTQIKMFGANSLEKYIEYEENLELWKDSNWIQFYIRELSALATAEVPYTEEFWAHRLDGSPIQISSMSNIIDGDVFPIISSILM